MRKTKSKFLLLNLFMLLLTACHKDLPEPEAKSKVIPMVSVETSQDVPVVGREDNQSFSVQHHVKNQNVFVECMIPNFSFREHHKNKGKMVLYVDGEKKEEIKTAAFIIKGLTPGTHKIKLSVFKSDNDQTASMEKEFTVDIP
ncbi:hypothetical protein [Bacillus dakarensis]|uniref:hypothetical protein n=1 Tax=Robertmurraya dakarensis TaxID=1926278 RepID=UPI000980CC4A|nr:hypothetical protein [Bacillus dakarensis]